MGNFRCQTGGRQASAAGGGGRQEEATFTGHSRLNEMQLVAICAAIRKLTLRLFTEGGRI